MFRQFRNVIKDIGARGWILEQDDHGMYLSRWHDEFNEDEFRIYIQQNENGIEISRAVKIRNYNKIKEVEADNPYLAKAKEICSVFMERYKSVLQA